MAKQEALRKGTTRERAAAPRPLRDMSAAAAAAAAAAATNAASTTSAGGENAAAATTELDRLIHERLRLGIISALAVNESLSFNELKALLKTTDGNLSVHARKLEDANYIACEKFFEGRTPKTEYRLTAAGRHALEHYLGHMEALIRATRVR